MFYVVHQGMIKVKRDTKEQAIEAATKITQAHRYVVEIFEKVMEVRPKEVPVDVITIKTCRSISDAT